MTLDTDGREKLFTQCQVTDYRLCGEALADWNIIEYFINSYEANIDLKSKTINNQLDDEELDLDRAPRQRGWPHQECVQYLPSHPKSKQKHHIICTEGHNNLPNFFGHYFSHCDDPEQYSFYCAFMLMLLKPWRNVKTDLKLPSDS